MELGAGLDNPTKIFQDNLGSIKWTEKRTEVRHVKHMALKYSRIRELVENHELEALYVPLAEYKADSLTKALPDVTAEQHRKYLEIADVNLRGRVGTKPSD